MDLARRSACDDIAVLEERCNNLERQLHEQLRNPRSCIDIRCREMVEQLRAEMCRYLQIPMDDVTGIQMHHTLSADNEGAVEGDQLDPTSRVTIVDSGRSAEPIENLSPMEYEARNLPQIGMELTITITEGNVVFPSDTQLSNEPPLSYTASPGGPHVLIGRTVDNTIQVSGSDVSRSHFEIRYSDAGRWEAKDLGSTTGTFFLLPPHCACPLFMGIVIKMGETEFVVLSCDATDVTSNMVLLCKEGPGAGQRFMVGRGEFNIGRRANNHLVLPDDRASSHHAQITFETHDPGWVLTDLGSSNGTSIRLSPEKTPSAWHEIFDEDVLLAGQTKFSCRMQADLIF